MMATQRQYHVAVILLVLAVNSSVGECFVTSFASFAMPLRIQKVSMDSSALEHARPQQLTSKLFPRIKANRPLHRGRSSLTMVLGPIGPLCPFQSSYMQSSDIERGMESLSTNAGDFYGPYMRFCLEIQAGKMPAKEEVAKLAEEMEKCSDNWKMLMTRFQLAPDFQAQQLWKLTVEFFEGKGVSFAQLLAAYEWQVQALNAFVDERPPPAVPAELNDMLQNPQMASPPASFMDEGFSSGVTAEPYTSEALQSPVVREELASLVKDHKMLVQMGEQYGRWDREGKRMYIDQLEAIEERWDVFMKRFELMGEQNPMFIQQAEDYLAKLQVTPDEYRDLVKRIRQQMREEAERT